MIPVVDDFRSSAMTHRFGDLFNPPGLTNFLGCVQSDVDPVAIRSLNFPPFACSDTITARLYVNGKFFSATGSPVTTVWYPDRIDRDADYDGLHFHSATALPMGKMAAIVRFTVENRAARPREVTLKLGLRGGVTKSVTPWTNAAPPTEADNAVEIERHRGALLFRAVHSSAWLLQGTSPRPDEITPLGLRFTFTLRPGETKTISFVDALGETRDDAERTYDGLIHGVGDELARIRAEWNRELAAVFTPDSGRYSGFMPTLETSDPDILRLYHMGILGVIYFKRDTPWSVYGRAYGTLMPKYWQPVTFIWDYSLSSLVHALLDPAVMRNYLELWMHTDIHKHFGTEFLTGKGVGPWYSVNDFAMTTICREYLRWTGDFKWLDRRVPGSQNNGHVFHYVEKYATNWRRFRGDNGLADYGELDNLLECVNTYLHQVASLNAANVFSMRTVADLLALRGEPDKATKLRKESAALVAEVNKLYANGKGYWHARFPDGSLREVRHVYDVLTILNTIPDDLSAAQKREMTEFFRRELMTPRWLHALSCDDDNATFSVRPDHQWTGAYPAWPPMSAMGLYHVGEVDLAFDWLKGLAKSANQGPFGQAHFAESVVAPEDGGAIKAPADWPYITDWTCSSNGSWVNPIIECIFGVRATLGQGITAAPQFGRFDPDAVLRNLRYQGKTYTVTRKGITPSDR
jgi:hypothetical protein